MSLNFGLVFAFRNSSRNELSYHERYRATLDLACETEQHGFDTVWLTEHHMIEDGYSPQMLPLATAIAYRTSTIRIATGVLLLPLHHPLHVAEQAATVDVVSNGRLDLGLGQGYKLEEFRAFDVPREARLARFVEGTEIIRRVLSEDEVTFEGEEYTVRDFTLYPKPVQQPVPIWIGARAKAGIRRAARNGYHLVGDPVSYRQALEEAGRDPARHFATGGGVVHCAETREQALDEAEFEAHYMWLKYGEWYRAAGDLPSDEQTFAEPAPVGEYRKQLAGNSLIGSPDDLIVQLEAMQAQGATHLFGLLPPGLAPEKVRSSMRLIEREVMPHFRAKGPTPDPGRAAAAA